MDKTEQFIKMADCPEIQGQWGIEEGDYYYNSGDTFEKKFPVYREVRLLFMGGHIDGRHHLIEDRWKKVTEHGKGRAKDYLWLPRQDQIQEMMGITDGYYFYHSFVNKVFTNETYLYYRNMTPEQLWLAFYMWEYHQKVWSSKKEKWVKE